MSRIRIALSIFVAANKDSACNENLKVTLTIASSLTHQLSKNTDPRKSNSLNDEQYKKEQLSNHTKVLHENNCEKQHENSPQKEHSQEKW